LPKMPASAPLAGAVVPVVSVEKENARQVRPWLDKSALPWAVMWLSSKDSNGVPQSATVMLSDRQMFSGRELRVVNGGVLLDGAFLSTVPTGASNLTAGVEVPAVKVRR